MRTREEFDKRLLELGANKNQIGTRSADLYFAAMSEAEDIDEVYHYLKEDIKKWDYALLDIANQQHIVEKARRIVDGYEPITKLISEIETIELRDSLRIASVYIALTNSDVAEVLERFLPHYNDVNDDSCEYYDDDKC